MKQVVAFLEKYAQWLALALGALLVLLMVWWYVLSPDRLKSEVAGDKLFPGEVDAKIAGTRAKELETRIKTPADEELKKRMVVVSFADLFQKNLSQQDLDPKYSSVVVWRPAVPGEQAVDAPQVTQMQKVEGPPVLPVATSSGSTSGQSFVGPPQPLANPENPNPAAPAPAAAAAGKDLVWITNEWRIDVKALADAWNKVLDPQKFPNVSVTTQFLYVEVEREELIGANQWGNKTLLNPLPLVKNLPAWPAGGKFENKNAENQYLVDTEKRQVEIVMPPFYQVLKGDPWTTPALGPAQPGAAPQQMVENTPFDPANPPTNRPLTPQEKQAVYKYNQKKKEEEAKTKAQERKNTQPPRSSGGRSSGSSPIPLILAQAQVEEPGQMVAPRRVAPRPAAPAAKKPDAAPAPGDASRSSAQDVTQLANALTAAFEPPKLAGGQVANPEGGNQGGAVKEFVVWAHDENILPGKTYRYHMRYYMKNPLYQTLNLVQNLADQDKFWIVSDWSQWQRVEAPMSVQFWFASRKLNLRTNQVDSVTVDVFKKVNGEWSKETFPIAPGDSIGQKKGEIDYSTGSTLVDFRTDSRGDVRLILADDKGNLDSRSFQAQPNTELYNELKQRLNAPKPTGDPTAGGGAPAVLNVGGSPP